MSEKSRNLLLLFLLASCWGPSFLFIKVAVAEISPMMLAALRIGSGALILNVFLLAKGQRLSLKWNFWKHAIIAGFFAQGLPFVLINWGEQYVDSSLASLLNGMVPLFTIVLAQILLVDERMTMNKVQGVIAGLIGLFILVLPNLRDGVQGTTGGVIAISVATLSYGIGLVYIRKHLTKIPPVHAPAAQLLSVSIYLVPIAWISTPDFSFSEISWSALGSVAILGTFGTAIAFILYFRLIERTNAGFASMVTFLMPIYGVLLGVIFLEEDLTLWMVWGAIFILGGISLVNKKTGVKRRKFSEHLDRSMYCKFR